MNRQGVLVTAIASLFLMLSPWLAPLSAEPGWNRFRGPGGNGISADGELPLTWTEKDYRWRVELPGIGHSSPVVAGDKVFITAAKEVDSPASKEAEIIRTVCAFSTKDGHLVWRREFPCPKHPKNALNSYASPTPVLDAERLYLPLATPQSYPVVALRQSDGELVWTEELGPYEAEHGYGASPIVFENLVICTNDQNGPSSIVALDCRTGQVRWTTKRKVDRAAYATPCLFSPPDGPVQLILSSSAQGISSLDPRTGKENWEVAKFKHRAVGSPALIDGVVLATCGTGGVGKQLLAVRPGRPEKGQPPAVAYELKPPIPYVPTPLDCGKVAFLAGDAGIFACINAATGETLWQERIGGKYFASPIRIGQRIYCVSRDGEMVVLKAGDHCELLARFSLGEPSQATPAFVDGTLYLRTTGHLMALSGKQ